MTVEQASLQERIEDTYKRHTGSDYFSDVALSAVRYNPLLSLKERIAIVTGASKGIGRATAELLGILGANLLIHGRNEAQLTEVAEVIQQGFGRRVEIVIGDMADPDMASYLGKVARERFEGGVHILVNNAGAPADKLFDKTNPKNWKEFDEAAQANLLGTLRVTSAVYPLIQKAGPLGRIISVGSVAGEEGNAGQTLYAAFKAGIAAATKSWAAELMRTGGTANVVAYGPVETAVWDRARTVGRKMIERAGGDPTLDPLKPIANRMISQKFTTPEEAARTILYLASDMGSQTTRQVLIVDGGITTLSLA